MLSSTIGKVYFLEIFLPKRSNQPKIRQLFLNTIRFQTLVEVLEIDRIQMLILVEA